MDSISLGLHVLFVALLVGPQILLFYAVIPSTWLIDDEQLRSSVARVVTMRFGILVVVALVGLLVTGLFQFYSGDVVPEFVRDDMMDYRWGLIFSTKMTLLLVLIALIAVHTIVFGRRIREASDAVVAGDEEAKWKLENLRRNSLLFSMLIVLVSIALVLLGATLAHHPYSLVER